MTDGQLQAFLEKISGDPALRAKLNEEGADITSIAMEAGFEVTPLDWQAYQDSASSTSELSDKELEIAVGGALCYNTRSGEPPTDANGGSNYFYTACC